MDSRDPVSLEPQATVAGAAVPRRRRAGVFARMADVLVRVDEPPHRVAAAFALGAGLGFSPFLGIQIVTGIALAVALRLNKVAVTAGLFINLPWIQLPYYWIATAAAGRALGTPVPDDVRTALGALVSTSPFREAFWVQVKTLLLPWLLPFAVGTMAGALVIAAVAYLGALRMLERRAARREDS